MKKKEVPPHMKKKNFKMPSKMQMFKNLAMTFYDVAYSVLAYDKGVLASQEVVEARLAECEKCPYRKQDRCTLCGCVLRYKAGIEAATCPDNRWEVTENPKAKEDSKE